MPPKPQADERCHGEEQKSIEGEKLLSIWASTKSGDGLLAPALKFKEEGLLLSKELRLVQFWCWYLAAGKKPISKLSLNRPGTRLIRWCGKTVLRVMAR